MSDSYKDKTVELAPKQKHLTQEKLDPWTGDINWPVDPRSFNLINSPSSTIKRRFSYTPVGIKKVIPGTNWFPFNWLQVINIFLGSLAVLLMVKLVSLLFVR